MNKRSFVPVSLYFYLLSIVFSVGTWAQTPAPATPTNWATLRGQLYSTVSQADCEGAVDREVTPSATPLVNRCRAAYAAVRSFSSSLVLPTADSRPTTYLSQGTACCNPSSENSTCSQRLSGNINMLTRYNATVPAAQQLRATAQSSGISNPGRLQGDALGLDAERLEYDAGVCDALKAACSSVASRAASATARTACANLTAGTIADQALRLRADQTASYNTSSTTAGQSTEEQQQAQQEEPPPSDSDDDEDPSPRRRSGGFDPSSLIGLAQAFMQPQSATMPESITIDCNLPENAAMWVCKPQAKPPESWNQQSAGGFDPASTNPTGGFALNSTVPLDTTTPLPGMQPMGTPITTPTVANNTGGGIPGGGGGGAMPGPPPNPGAGLNKPVNTDILNGFKSGGGASPSAISTDPASASGGFSYGQGGEEGGGSPVGMDLKQYLPGGSEYKSRSIAGVAGAEIQSQGANIWNRVSERLRSRCIQGRLRDCDMGLPNKN